MTQKAAPVVASPKGHSILTISVKDYKVRIQWDLKMYTQTQKKKRGVAPRSPTLSDRGTGIGGLDVRKMGGEG
jgi:hypothetical protein